MKKTFLILLLASSILLGGCKREINTEHTSGTETDTEAETISVPDDAYLEIECVEAKRYVNTHFAFREDQITFCLNSPTEWSFEKNGEDAYTVKRNGKKIGTFVCGAESETDLTNWKTLKTKDSIDSGLHCDYFLEKSRVGEFRHRYVYQYRDGDRERIFTLTVDYAEVSDFTYRKLLLNSSNYKISTDPQMGILSNSRKMDILILGNSFIGTSAVGYILEDMLQENGKNCSVTAISRGYATVATYINDAELMNRIRNFRYTEVFICGFYSSSEIENLGALKAACDASGTRLVIFPAHNESASVVQSACSKYDTLTFLNWKGEIDALIRSGVPGSALYINDTHNHSTELAGYVGAHMIYRALYGEAPKGSVSGMISQSYVNSYLGNYVKTGAIQLIDQDTILYFD